MLYSQNHVWIDERDPDNARVGLASYFSGSRNPAAIPAPVDFTIVSFRTNVPLRDINSDPEGTGYIAVVSCTDPSQFENLMSAGEYSVYCEEGADEDLERIQQSCSISPGPLRAGADLRNDRRLLTAQPAIRSRGCRSSHARPAVYLSSYIFSGPLCCISCHLSGI
jgi:glycine cleavage system H lipoate-binding protein